MSHQHFCDVAGHYWECQGTALRGGDAEPSVCVCLPCGLPLEGFEHSKCPNPVELLACPEHREGERRMIDEVKMRHGGRAAKPGSGETDAALTRAEGGELPDVAPAERASPADREPAQPFERFPLVPIGPGDPLYCPDCCNCGCSRMPRKLSGGFCLHCFHEYQLNDPEFWLGEEFPHSQAAHLKNCVSYQEYHKKAEEGLAKFQAMIKGADDETFHKLFNACYSQAIDDNYEAYMSAPEGSAERAAIVERIAAANAKETEARDLPGEVKQRLRSGEIVPVAPPSRMGMASNEEHVKEGPPITEPDADEPHRC